jgi:hypothetical protein
MRKALLIIVTSLCGFLIAAETRAQCSCVSERRNITAEKEFSLAYAVFVGKVLTVHNTPRDDKDRYVETVTFAVTKAWKRDLNSNLTVTNTIQGCANGFDRNEEWLIYAYRDADGTLGTYCCCTRTTLLVNATDDLQFLANEAPAKILDERVLNTGGPNKSLNRSGGSAPRIKRDPAKLLGIAPPG